MAPLQGLRIPPPTDHPGRCPGLSYASLSGSVPVAVLLKTLGCQSPAHSVVLQGRLNRSAVAAGRARRIQTRFPSDESLGYSPAPLRGDCASTRPGDPNTDAESEVDLPGKQPSVGRLLANPRPIHELDPPGSLGRPKRLHVACLPYRSRRLIKVGRGCRRHASE